jgi:hypothetical protein
MYLLTPDICVRLLSIHDGDNNAYVYIGRMQYCANDIDRGAIYPVEQTDGINKQEHEAQAYELWSKINFENFDSFLSFSVTTLFQQIRLL